MLTRSIRYSLALLFAMACGLFALTGCEEKTDAEKAVDDAQDTTEEAVDDAQDATEEAVEDAADAVEDAGDAVEDAAEGS